MEENELTPEISALKETNDFPAPDAARDARVKEAMDRALAKTGRRRASRWAGRHRRLLAWGAGLAAAGLVVALGLGEVHRAWRVGSPSPGNNDAALASSGIAVDVYSRFLNPQENFLAEESDGGANDALWGPPRRPGDLGAKVSTIFDDSSAPYTDTFELERSGGTGFTILGRDNDKHDLSDNVQAGLWYMSPEGSEPDEANQKDHVLTRVGTFSIEGLASVHKKSGTATSATTWKESQLTGNTCRLMVGDKEELPLRGLQAQARVDGFRARVILDLYFFSDRDRQLEGNFQLRLPNGASPYLFAFGETVFTAKDGTPSDRPIFFGLEDARRMGFEPAQAIADRAASWTGVKEARMVPREKAALAYRETVRRVVDPAILEWSGAGIFSARVFPLAPRRLHRVVIGYDVDLQRSGGDLEYRLELPQGVPQTSVDLDLARIPGVTAEVSPKVEPLEGAGRSHYRFDDLHERAVTLRQKAPGPLILAGRDPRTGPYFAASFRPEIPSVAGAGAPRAIFLVDTSLSSSSARFGVWLKLLRAILDENRDTLKEFAVLFFNVDSFFWQEKPVANTPENVQALLAFAGNLALEGATDLGRALAEAVSPAWAAPEWKSAPRDLFLLSDGAATWGETELRALSRILRSGPPAALFGYSTGIAGTDLRLLDALARESGGAVFSVTGEGEILKAARAHRSRPWRLEGVEIEGGTDLLLAGRPASVYAGQDLLLLGRGAPPASAEVALKLSSAGETRTVRSKLDHSIPSELAARAYGQAAVGQLEELGEPTSDVSRAYAQHFRVTGSTCSLLMLASEADYQHYDIKPEEDAFVVERSAASAVIAKTLAELGQALGDPKASFLAWLRKLEKTAGVSLSPTSAFKLALEAMDRSAFEVAAPPLSVRARTHSAIPGAFQEVLASQNLDYDLVAAEGLRRLKEIGPADALKALSSLIESRPGDAVLARDVAFSAVEWGLGGQAYHLFRRVADSRPFEPETYRALAQCLSGMGRADLALCFYEIGLAGRWDARFGEFRRILGLEYLHFLRQVVAGTLRSSVADFARARLETVSSEFDLGKADLLVTISWNTDGTDVDLHVTEPTGEECFYSHRQTRMGGQITQDVTQGYGPEMYTLKKAEPGDYRIRVHYFSSDRNRASARTKVEAAVFENWGTPEERVTRKTVVLADQKDLHDIATIRIGK
jgi:hypothetical protein